jgi:hypothetical protein
LELFWDVAQVDIAPAAIKNIAKRMTEKEVMDGMKRVADGGLRFFGVRNREKFTRW